VIRRFEKRGSDDIIRRCRCCGTTDNDIPFLVQKDSKSGRYYKHCICQACYAENRTENRIRYYLDNRDEQIASARAWNVENRDRYNERRRKTFREKMWRV
jgi:hypothetical protein